MAEKRTVTMKGNVMTLSGELPRKGEKIPDVELLDTGLSPVRVSEFAGKVLLIVAVPSLDTAVCNLEARRFNQEAEKLGERVQVLVVSMDLPFAQKRWVEEAKVERLKTVSDHREAAFGRAYGVLMEEARLLARSVFVADQEGRLRYVQVVPEATDEPDYDSALEAARELARSAAA